MVTEQPRDQQELNRRLRELQDVVMALARLEFDVQASMGDGEDELDAVAVGLNMLGEELEVSTVSTAFLDNIVESMIDALVVLELDGTIRIVNSATCRLLGYQRDDLRGRHVGVLFGADEQRHVSFLEEVLVRGVAADQQVQFRAVDGETIPITLNGSTMADHRGEVEAVVLVGRDLRETRRLLAEAAMAVAQKARAAELEEAYRELQQTQAQLVQMGKLAAVGELAAGVAHELNQPITSIRGFCELLRVGADNLTVQQRAMAERIHNATRRMTSIIDNLRLFSRQSSLALEPIPALDPLDKAIELVSEQLRLHEIQVDWHVIGDPAPVLGEPIRLQQVFLNLLSNARYAMDALDEDCEKRLILSVHDEGRDVVYVVQDNGPGVRAEHRPHLFDPFFTTKPPGEGVGLGLSLSHGIVEDHGGTIRFEPVQGRGARFTVSIPASPDGVAEHDMEEGEIR